MRALAVLALLVVAASLSLGAQPPATQPAQIPPQVERVLKYVPDDADLVVVVPSLDGLVQGLAGFGKAIGLPELADLSVQDLLEKPLGRSAAGLDTSGALVLALSATQDEPLLIASLASDASWKAATQPVTLRDDVLLYDFGPDRHLAAVAGRVAIFAREKSELRRAVDSTGKFAGRLPKAVGDLLGQRSIVVYAEVSAWAQRVEASTAWLIQGMQVGMTAAGPEAEAAMRMWSFMLDQFKKVLSEARTLVVTARVDAQGAWVDCRVTFRSDGSVAGYLGQVHKPGRDLLRGLPAGDSPLVLGYEWEGPADSEGLDAALSRLFLNMESLKEKVGAEKLQAIIKTDAEIKRRMSGASTVCSFAENGSGLSYRGLYLTREGAEVQRGMGSVFELTPELMSAWGTFRGAVVRRDPEQVSGVQADVYQLNFEAGDSPLQHTVLAVYGSNPTLYLAPHPEGVAYAFGPPETARQKLAELLDAEASPLGRVARVRDTLDRFSADPQICMLADAPALLKGCTAMLEQMGIPFPTVELPDEPTPLAGFTFYLQPEALRAELFVPAEPIKMIVKLVQQAQGPAKEAY
jgi:hypothetical protein